MTRGDDGRLIGWKAIGNFLGRDERTVRRWEAERRLPVNRVPGGGSATVWADPAALRAWLQSGGADSPANDVKVEQPKAANPPKRRFSGVVFLSAVALIAAVPWGWQALSSADANAVSTMAPPAPYGTDQAANTKYRDARFGLSRRSVDGLFAASASFTELSKQYPKVAAGYAGQAEAALLLREFNSLPNDVAYRRATDSARKALALDPKSPVASRALAFALFHGEGKRSEALKLFAQAIALDPAQAQSHHWYGTALLSEGRTREALASLERARALDAGSSAVAADTAYTRYIDGQKAQAVEELQRIVRIDPRFSGAWSYLARFALIEGRDVAFLDAAAIDAKLRDDKAAITRIARAKQAQSKGGRRAMIAAMLGDEMARYDQDSNNALNIALIHAAAGNGDAVLRWLEQAESNGEPHLRTSGGFAEFVPYRHRIDTSLSLKVAKN